jgi:glycyl-tRNA synthetase
MAEQTRMETIMSFAKRRGFVFPTAEIYGGLQGFWDWGPLGVELKNNIKQAWWRKFVQMRSDVVGVDSTIITNPKVFEKSGHLKGFHDALVECKKCHQRYKADDLVTGKPCANCGAKDFTKASQFNLMFKTFTGPSEDSAATVYLRPETAQGIFVNFQNVQQSMRLKLPFGIAQIGKAFRNEITPGNFIFRSREFEQMELEYFCKPGEDDKWFEFWRDESMKWFLDLGLKKENLRMFDQPKAELAHYSKATTDIEYKFPFSAKGGPASGGDKGWAELMGIANRTDFDLKAHGQTFRDEEQKSDITPYCIEPSAGVDRAALAFLLDAYEEIEGGRTTTTESNKEKEVVLRLHKSLAPIKVAILPLSKKEPLASKAQEIANELRKYWTVMYDDTQSIGRRYRRQDEIGTPYCVTVDFDTIEKDQKVTVRDRDTMEQERIKISELSSYMRDRLVS